jgi:probable HAF family extracellular repeat protein
MKNKHYNNLRKHWLFLLVCLLMFLPCMLYAQTQYTVIGLGGGTDSYATDINNAGQVVGAGHFASGERHAFLWQYGSITDLGTLYGDDISWATGINSYGHVVGYSSNSPVDTLAFLWQYGTMTEYPGGCDPEGLGSSRINSYAHDINDAGQVVGYAACLDDMGTERDWRAFLWQNGTINELGNLAGMAGKASFANAINNSGQMVGGSENSSGDFHAFLWENGIMTDLGTLGGGLSEAHGINNSGQVVGESIKNDGQWHAFLWQNGTMIDLNSVIPSTSGWEIIEALAINDSGQIVGYGYFNGLSRAILLTPLIGNDRIAALEKRLAAVEQALQNCGCTPQPTAVQLSSLKAIPSNKKVTLEWQTETETDNAGFNVWRAEGFQKINKALIPASGSTVSGSEYDFVDQWVLNGKRYFYLLEDIDTNGISTFHGPVKVVPRRWLGVGK